MSDQNTPPIPDKWYALTQLGKVLKEGRLPEFVRSDEAFYYVQCMYYSQRSGTSYFKYKLFNTALTTAMLKYNGISCKDLEFAEVAHVQDVHYRKIRFNLVDKCSVTETSMFDGGIEAFQACIKHMDELGKYGTIRERDLTKKVKHQEDIIKATSEDISKLRIKIQELEYKLDEIYKSKSDLRKLTQLLYEN
ncbi:hypothetical protein ACFSRY_10025 [Pontibacter locisalis]|uniref:Uncharacterized protein n=1 Tax=Pontibacter locisalis TaxID=1719035 RepID=A0ABW5IN89_9BACT